MMPKKPAAFTMTAAHVPDPVNQGSRLLFLKIGSRALKKLAGRVFTFYLDGFRRMGLGRILWVIVIIKLLIMFGVLKLFFFPDYLSENFTSDAERAEHVMTELTQRSTRK